jgi:Zn-dependent peptidase ImmA (M78 family)
MRRPTREAIERIAEQLLDKLGIDEAPVDVQTVAERLGYEVIFERFTSDLSGTLIRDKDGTVTIGINSFHAHVRQRFSIAHEIGHAELHATRHAVNESLVYVDPPGPMVLFRDGRAAEGKHSDEIDANRFAASLLMPRPFIREEASKLLERTPGASEAQIVEALADTFRVSTQAMRYRLVNLGVMEPE